MSVIEIASNRTPALSATHSPISRLDEIHEDLQRRIVLDSDRLPMAFRRGSYPSIEERTAALEAVQNARIGMRAPASTGEIAKAVRLLLGGMKAPAGIDAEGMAEAYSMALEETKGLALRKAVRSLIGGKAPDRFSKTFMPSAPELASYCEEIERFAGLVANRMERLLALPEQKPPEAEMSDEERAENLRKIAEAMRSAKFRTEGKGEAT